MHYFYPPQTLHSQPEQVSVSPLLSKATSQRPCLNAEEEEEVIQQAFEQPLLLLATLHLASFAQLFGLTKLAYLLLLPHGYPLAPKPLLLLLNQ